MTDTQIEMIIRLRKSGMGYTEVARETGISKDTVKSFCQRNKLGGRLGQGKSEEGTVCPQCGKKLDLNAKTRKPRFCCEACRRAWWRAHPEAGVKKAVYEYTCACCGTPFSAYGNSRRKYCCHSCYISDRFGKGLAV